MHRAIMENYGHNIYIKPSTLGPDVGLGAFCRVDIKKGHPVGVYTGVSSRFYKDCNTDYLFNHVDGRDINGKLRIGNIVCSPQEAMDLHRTNKLDLELVFATYEGQDSNWCRFLNDPITKNSENLGYTRDGHRFGRALTFYAKKNIPAHTELFFKYGPHYWKTRMPQVADTHM